MIGGPRELHESVADAVSVKYTERTSVYCSLTSRNIILTAVKPEGVIAYLLTYQPTTNGKMSISPF